MHYVISRVTLQTALRASCSRVCSIHKCCIDRSQLIMHPRIPVTSCCFNGQIRQAVYNPRDISLFWGTKVMAVKARWFPITRVVSDMWPVFSLVFIKSSLVTDRVRSTTGRLCFDFLVKVLVSDQSLSD